VRRRTRAVPSVLRARASRLAWGMGNYPLTPTWEMAEILLTGDCDLVGNLGHAQPSDQPKYFRPHGEAAAPRPRPIQLVSRLMVAWPDRLRSMGSWDRIGMDRLGQAQLIGGLETPGRRSWPQCPERAWSVASRPWPQAAPASGHHRNSTDIGNPLSRVSGSLDSVGLDEWASEPAAARPCPLSEGMD
jgi:hypothetical protein